MYESFNASSKSVGDMLSRNERARIVVPEFQRGYSWEKKHVEAFWTDVRIFQEESGKKGGPERYFLGPIVVRPESKDALHLLDGQQRLATATILFSVIRDCARGLGIMAANDFARDTQVELIEKSKGVFSLELGEMDKLYFAETIQTDPPTDRKPTLRSHRYIQKAREVLMQSVRTLIGALDPTRALAVLEKLAQTLRSDLVMASIPVASEGDAFRIFETLNDRGLRLSVPDLLLNYLMRVAKPATDRPKIREVWNEMLEQMGRRDINRFLRHMWVSKYGDLKSQDLFTALKARIENDNIGSMGFARDCAEECTRYAQLLDVDEKHIQNSTVPYVRSLLRVLDFQSALPLLLAVYSRLNPEDFEKVAKWLLVFVTRYSIVQGLDSAGLETVLFALAREVRTIIADPKKKGGVMAHIKDTLAKNAPSDDQIKLSVQNLILSPEEAKYVLTRLATRMQTATKELKIDEANLEHIFPKKPSDEWKNPAELEPYLWHVGNLTMLGLRLNRDAANRGFPFKRAEYYEKSELTMATELAKDNATWDKDAVEKRAKKLAPLVVEIWNFDNPSRV